METRRHQTRIPGRSDRRRGHRVVYPDNLAQMRPLVCLDGRTFPVLDISEHGIRFERPRRSAPTEGQRLTLPVRFSPQDELSVEGTVVRTLGNIVAVHLERGFQYSVITREQIFLADVLPY